MSLKDEFHPYFTLFRIKDKFSEQHIYTQELFREEIESWKNE